jgi:hypothetical protein
VRRQLVVQAAQHAALAAGVVVLYEATRQRFAGGLQRGQPLGLPKFDATTPFSAAAVHQSDGGSTTYTIPTVVFAEPV